MRRGECSVRQIRPEDITMLHQECSRFTIYGETIRQHPRHRFHAFEAFDDRVGGGSDTVLIVAVDGDHGYSVGAGHLAEQKILDDAAPVRCEERHVRGNRHGADGQCQQHEQNDEERQRKAPKHVTHVRFVSQSCRRSAGQSRSARRQRRAPRSRCPADDRGAVRLAATCGASIPTAHRRPRA